MQDRFLETCTASPDFDRGTNSLVWCRKAHAEELRKLKQVSDQADELVLVWLTVREDLVVQEVESLEDIYSLTSAKRDLTFGPPTVLNSVEGDKVSVTIKAQTNPALVKLRLTASLEPSLFGEIVHAQFITTADMWHSPDWRTYTMRNGQERAVRRSSHPAFMHRILVECDTPDS